MHFTAQKAQLTDETFFSRLPRSNFMSSTEKPNKKLKKLL